MDPLESVVKNPYTSINIPRAHLRPDLEQQLEQSQDTPYPGARPSPVPAYSPPTVGGWTQEEAKGGSQIPTQATWQQPGNPYAGLQQTSGTTEPPYTTVPPARPGDDIAHHCCCCPCCRCCRCPRCCRCHSCCCVVS
ncbi:cysteine-rich tail protein 1 [Dromiciops gliroides]|uniref:cysteine-rich tail protein 1 n=1 Tax=Dromiciops gliroides TaxID=33562 RepID=UPI001CC77CB3|nr:cysteine-rich tail protein 1 [Dromiciops gliroides]XP_043842310.1 cysteine-rich tail protein 1 [Dromiciops gliroides]XP_043842311.1 cysteine-rich tail protein 1 [Dromiciops gliroides]XP_043842312.1 cysteine-rich tail protein 1 [Dromiciops gliroides]